MSSKQIIYGLCLISIINYSKGFAQKSNQAPILNLLSEKTFNNCFPLKNPFYNYTAFAKAIKEMSFIKIKIEKQGDWIYKITRIDKKGNKTTVIRQDKDWDAPWAKAKTNSIIEVDYANFCNNSNQLLNKKELAAFFAHLAHETRNGKNNSYNDGLMLLNEINTTNNYITENEIYPAVIGKKYYGRGPLQLSYNGNYGFASHCIFGDKTILLNNPDLITSNADVAFKTAIYFWMTPQSLKPSAHNAMIGQWKPTETEIELGYKPGFGATINIINGAVECKQGQNQLAMVDRINFYQHFLKLFNIKDENCECSCANMPPFGANK